MSVQKIYPTMDTTGNSPSFWVDTGKFKARIRFSWAPTLLLEQLFLDENPAYTPEDFLRIYNGYAKKMHSNFTESEARALAIQAKNLSKIWKAFDNLNSRKLSPIVTYIYK